MHEHVVAVQHTGQHREHQHAEDYGNSEGIGLKSGGTVGSVGQIETLFILFIFANQLRIRETNETIFRNTVGSLGHLIYLCHEIFHAATLDRQRLLGIDLQLYE